MSLLLWEGRSLTFVADQAGHSVATLAKHYAGVLEELEDKPRIPAAEAIREARSKLRCAQSVRTPQKTELTPPPEPLQTTIWAMLGSNQRPPPCRDGALPAELIARESLNVPPRPLCGWGGVRLAAEMRWRAGAVLALIGIAAIPGVSYALEPIGGSSVHVSVKPASGSPATHFAVSFKAVQTTGIVGDTRSSYRVTASDTAREGCESTVAAVAPPTHKGATVVVKLAPKAGERWCVGAFHGQVWNEVFPVCQAGKVCPALAFPPRVVGKFSFRVKRS